MVWPWRRAKAPASEGVALPRWKKALLGACVVVGFFGLAEVALRVGGFGAETGRRAALEVYGESPDPFVLEPMGSGRQRCRVAGEGFRPAEFECPKPQGEFRVFCFGGSTTAGYGVRAEEAFPAQLEALLMKPYPGRRVRVINLGRDALESFRVRSLMGRVEASFEPDLLVVYCGHNDFINASRVTDVSRLAALSRDELERRAGLYRLVRQSRVFLLVERAVWAGRDAAKSRPVSADDFARTRRALFERAGAAYEVYMKDMTQGAAKARVPVVLCTVVSVSLGVPPFLSANDPELSYTDRAALQEYSNQMRHALMRGDREAAEAAGRLAITVDRTSAQALYDYGVTLAALGRGDEAREFLSRARDEDLSGWRAPSRVNEFLRRLSAAEGAALADVERAFEARSPLRVVDRQFFLDSIHPNAAGHRVIAETAAQAVAERK